ncbi:MAG: DUF6894 family protein [Bradyrhizobium sp.]
MPRYYVHFRDGSSPFKDEVGEVFADASLPLRFAIALCQEDRPRTGAGRRGAGSVIVVAEGDQHLFEVPLSERGN